METEITKEKKIYDLLNDIIEDYKGDKDFLKKESEEHKLRSNKIITDKLSSKISNIEERLNKVSEVISRLCEKHEKLICLLDKKKIEMRIEGKAFKRNQLLNDNQLKIYNTYTNNKEKTRYEIAKMLNLTYDSLTVSLSRIRAKGYIV
jgi:hypothetical protein